MAGEVTKFGVVLPQHDAGREELFGAAALAEASGLDSVWLSDHLWGRGDPGRPFLEGWVALAAVAAATERVVVGSLVLRTSLRRPRMVAAMVGTAASIAPGRIVAGLGIGDRSAAAEQEAYGIPLAPRAARLADLESAIRGIREVCPGVPVWVGGGSEEVLRMAARADGWSFWGPASEFPSRLARLRVLGGAKMPEVSWGGPHPGEEALAALEEAGCGHIVVPQAARRYREGIERLAEYKAGR